MIDIDSSRLSCVSAGTLLDGVYLRPFDNPNPLDPFAFLNNQPPPPTVEIAGGLASTGLTGSTYPWLTEPGSSSLTGQP